jgi:hypothetical protein
MTEFCSRLKSVADHTEGAGAQGEEEEDQYEDEYEYDDDDDDEEDEENEEDEVCVTGATGALTEVSRITGAARSEEEEAAAEDVEEGTDKGTAPFDFPIFLPPTLLPGLL